MFQFFLESEQTTARKQICYQRNRASSKKEHATPGRCANDSRQGRFSGLKKAFGMLAAESRTTMEGLAFLFFKIGSV